MMYFYEDKKVVIQMLLQALRCTVAGVDLADIEYKVLTDGTEIATLIYDTGYRKNINISFDSGIALMRDILREVD